MSTNTKSEPTLLMIRNVKIKCIAYMLCMVLLNIYVNYKKLKDDYQVITVIKNDSHNADDEIIDNNNQNHVICNIDTIDDGTVNVTIKIDGDRSDVSNNVEDNNKLQDVALKPSGDWFFVSLYNGILNWRAFL